MRWQCWKASKQADIMSTTDFDAGSPLDVDTLARLANEYFSAWSGSDAQTPQPKFPASAVSPVQLPGAAELHELLASIPAALAAEREPSSLARAPFDVNQIRRDFPILAERVNGRQLVWLDNAATTQKPQAVIDRLKYFYEHENSNVHRAAHELAARATDAYEGAREKVRGFLNAPSAEEVVFVRGATEAINPHFSHCMAEAVKTGRRAECGPDFLV
jgi:cysteine desulfurase/selenocysteine lyase